MKKLSLVGILLFAILASAIFSGALIVLLGY